MKLWEWSRQAEGRVFEGCFLCDGVDPLYRFTLSQPDWQWEAELNTDEKKDNQKRCVCLTITPSTPSVPLPMELSPGMMGGTRGEPGAVLHQPGEPAVGSRVGTLPRCLGVSTDLQVSVQLPLESASPAASQGREFWGA